MSDLLLIKAGYGSAANTAMQEVVNGTFRVTSDEQLYVDIANRRHYMGSVITGYTEAQIKVLAVANILKKVYLSSDTLKLFWYDTTNSEWVVVGGDHVALADVATNAYNDEDGNNIKATYETKSDANAKKAALDRDIADLNAAIAQIHSFEIRKVASKEELPLPGVGNILYLVPSDKQEPEQTNIYDEYIWVTDEEVVPYGGYYENIGTSEAALDNYYTKDQIDAQEAAINLAITTNDTASQNRDTALGTRIYNLTTTVATNKTASENADTALGERIDALTETVTTNDTASQNRDTALGTRIDNLTTTVTNNKTAADQTQADLDTLEDDVATINRFNTWYGLELPPLAEGDPYTIYFVADVGIPSEHEKYSEFIYVPYKEFKKRVPAEEDPSQTIEVTVTVPAHYERIDSTVDLLNYYTKAEVDAIAQALQNNITTNATDISNLSATVSSNRVASENRDSALDTRVTSLEDVIGDGSGAGTLSARMTAAEEAIVANDTASQSRDTALDTRLSAVETAIGDEETEDTILNRIKTTEDSLAAQITKEDTDFTGLDSRTTAIETAIGDEETADTILNRIKTTEDGLAAQVAKEAEDYTELDSRIDANDTDIEGLDSRLSEVEEIIGDGSGTDSLSSRMTAAEGRLDTAENNITSLTGRMTTAEGNITSMDAAYKAADVTLQDNIDTLSQEVASINRFNVVFVDSFEELPAIGQKYVIYFVPNESGSGDQQYIEYMWIETPEAETDGYYEQVDATSANLDNYYTKSQIDGKVSTINNTVDTNRAASESRDTALDTRVTSLEDVMGTDATAAGTVLNRLAAAETAITTNKTDSESRDSALDTRVTDLEEVMGSDATQSGTVLNRLAAAETAITTNDTASQSRDTALDTRLTAVEEAIGTGGGTGSLSDRMEDAEEAISDLQDLVGDGTGATDTIMNRMATAEDDIDDIQGELALHDWKYAGSATEGGAATNVVETETDEDGYQDILLADANHTATEYAAESVAQINPSTGALKVQSIVLGGATLVYDATSEAVVFNF